MPKYLIVFAVLLLLGCDKNSKRTETPSSPRIKKRTKLVSPKSNTRVLLGEAVSFELTSKSEPIDSVLLTYKGQKTSFTDASFTVSNPAKRVGTWKPKLTVYFNGKSETHYAKVIFLPSASPEAYTYEIINTYPHDENDYTQGLLIEKGFLYESSGQTKKSTLEKKEIKTGKTIQQINLEDQYFGEGLAVIEDQFYQITYTSGACFVYNRNFEKVNSFNYQGEGWGLCSYNGNLLMTNKTEKIAIRDPKTFAILDELEVYDDKGKFEAINELEIIDGLLYANVYLKDFIVAIDLETGAVVKKIDMQGLLSDQEKRNADVLNGIAYDPATGSIYVTGKWWPKLFEVKFVPKNNL